ncbi:MAG: DUF2336 domain-containing protein, partial [Proteobacteria bacterium]|nr:DUF2336 domain-containing protein [Pseudomonadota bacterium]
MSGRTRLVQVVGDLFFEEKAATNERERDLMAAILQQLIHDVEQSVRKALADRLAVEKNAPHDLVAILANDEIDVAHEILRSSEVLQDLELIEIIQHRTFEHQLTIAMRNNVSEAVSDALVETGNVKVIKTLIENEKATISDNTLEFLVNESKSREPYQLPLLDRPDFSPHLAKRMYWWVSAALRKHIVEEYKIDPAELDQTIESTIKDLLGGNPAPAARAASSEGEIIDTHSMDLARKLAATNAITPMLLLQTLRKGEVRMFEGMFAQLTGLRTNLVRRLIYEPGGEGLAIACKAAELTKPDFGSLFLLSRAARPGDKTVDPDEVARVMKFFDRL